VDVLANIKTKAKDLEGVRMELNQDLFLNTIKETSPSGDSAPVTFNTAFETVQIVNELRTWFATALDSYVDPVTQRIDPSRVGQLYRMLRRGGDAYLPLEEVVRRLRKYMPGCDWREAGEDLKMMKVYAAELVEDVCVNNLMLDVERHKIGWLTCVGVGVDDMPWSAQRGEGMDSVES